MALFCLPPIRFLSTYAAPSNYHHTSCMAYGDVRKICGSESDYYEFFRHSKRTGNRHAIIT